MGDMSAVVLAAASQAEGNFLIPNGTFFVVLIIFLIVLGVIGTFVVPPISKVLKERDNMITKTAADNKKSAEQFAAAQEDYEKALSAARVTASAARDEARAEGRKVLEDKRGRAEEEVSSTLQDAAEQLKREGDAVAADLRTRVESLSTTLASRILGVEITTSVPARVSGREQAMSTFLGQLIGFAVILLLVWRYVGPPRRKVMADQQNTVPQQLAASSAAADRLAEAS